MWSIVWKVWRLFLLGRFKVWNFWVHSSTTVKKSYLWGALQIVLTWIHREYQNLIIRFIIKIFLLHTWFWKTQRFFLSFSYICRLCKNKYQLFWSKCQYVYKITTYTYFKYVDPESGYVLASFKFGQITYCSFKYAN